MLFLQSRPVVCLDCKLEPVLGRLAPGTTVQFERQGYFSADQDSSPAQPVFNRTMGLRDGWAKIQAKQS